MHDRKKKLHIWYCFPSAVGQTVGGGRGKRCGKGVFGCVNGITFTLLALMKQSRLDTVEDKRKGLILLIRHVNYKFLLTLNTLIEAVLSDVVVKVNNHFFSVIF